MRFSLILWLILGSTYNCLGDKLKTVPLSNEKFSNSLYNLLRNQHQNLVFSPFSISTVMAMVSAGARGETLRQIKKGLFFPSSSTLQIEYRNIIPDIKSTKDFTLDTANKVFVKNDFTILNKFQKILTNSFYSNIKDIDFGDSEAAAHEINEWVEDRTRNAIKNLIEPSQINEKTRLVLVNAIYFKSNWAVNFNDAVDSYFKVSSTLRVRVPMMQKDDEVFYARLNSLSSAMIEIPYKGGRIVMQVLLPGYGRRIELEELENNLRYVAIHELFEKEKKKRAVDIRLPKFKIETTLQLDKDLKKLGLKKMFSAGADFSGITDEEGLHVSSVGQKAFIEVNEAGAEASAVTVVHNVAHTSHGDEDPIFRANRPFIFFIRDKKTGILLFQGRVTNPLK